MVTQNVGFGRQSNISLLLMHVTRCNRIKAREHIGQGSLVVQLTARPTAQVTIHWLLSPAKLYQKPKRTLLTLHYFRDASIA